MEENKQVKISWLKKNWQAVAIIAVITLALVAAYMGGATMQYSSDIKGCENYVKHKINDSCSKCFENYGYILDTGYTIPINETYDGVSSGSSE